jgi:hypothetical protein
VTETFIVIEGTGMAKITGYEDTDGEWIITANKRGGSFSFASSASAPTPDGGLTLILLGGALSGLALIRRKLA